MIEYASAPRAFGRTRAMARAGGWDLTAAVVDGWLSRAELAALISRCAGCNRASACDAFLSTARPGAGLPPYCANKTALDCARGT